MVATFSQDASLEAVAKQQLTPLKKKVSKRDNELFVNKEWYTSTPIKVGFICVLIDVSLVHLN